MEKVIKLKESDLINVVKNIISEETNNKMMSSAILGYIDKHWDKIVNDIYPDKMKGIVAKKEVMIHCENIRDGKPHKPLSKNAQVVYNTVKKIVKTLPNMGEYSNMGKNIKHI